jgi:uncharacterized protein YjbJ (UPF0337 family)
MADSSTSSSAQGQQGTGTLQSAVDAAKNTVTSTLGGQQVCPFSLPSPLFPPFPPSLFLVPFLLPFSSIPTSYPSQSPHDHPDRAQGRWEQTVGSAKETLGGLTGSANLKQQGADQRRAGEQKEAVGQMSDLGQGAADRAEGAMRSAIAGFKGDHEERAKWDAVHDRGKEVQRSVEKEVEGQTKAPEERAKGGR